MAGALGAALLQTLRPASTFLFLDGLLKISAHLQSRHGQILIGSLAQGTLHTGSQLLLGDSFVTQAPRKGKGEGAGGGHWPPILIQLHMAQTKTETLHV